MNTDALSLLIRDHEEVTDLFVQYEALSSRSVATKQKLAEQICYALTVHATIEEEIFYPAVREVIDDDDLMDEALVEHASAKDLIAQIQEMEAGDDLYDAKVKVLSEQIEHHVREEEGELFARLSGTELDLTALGAEMAARKAEIETIGI